MVRQSESKDLVTAWRALGGDSASEGWRTIPVASGKDFRLLAGRHFPGNEEAVLVGFRSVRVPSADSLPEGSGFVVHKVDLGTISDGQTWIALLRQALGNLEMFTLMATDVVATLEASETETDDRLFALFLGRIRAWQGFMHRGKEGVLSPEAELGLCGELVVLSSLLESGMVTTTAIESWCGPLDGLHDFRFGTGAIEVKSTLSGGGFPATVASLEQLDEGFAMPLYLAGVRLRLDETGLRLPDRVSEIRRVLQSDSGALATFDARMLHAGFSALLADRYTRRLKHVDTNVYLVNNGFPHLTRNHVPNEISRAKYEIDLDKVKASRVSIREALISLGVN